MFAISALESPSKTLQMMKKTDSSRDEISGMGDFFLAYMWSCS